jgi:hypothetical protein
MKKTKLSKVITLLPVAAFTICGLFSQAYAAPRLTVPVNVTFATQDVGSAMYTNASAIANVILPALPTGSAVDVTTTSPGGVGAPIIVENGDCDLTMGNAAPAKWAVETGVLGNPPTPNVRSIAGGMGKDFVNVLFTQAFVDKTGITTVEEVVAKKYPVNIAIKANGAFGELACFKVLEVLGVSYDDVRSWGGNRHPDRHRRHRQPFEGRQGGFDHRPCRSRASCDNRAVHDFRDVFPGSFGRNSHKDE